MAAPPTTNAGQSATSNSAPQVSDDADGVVKRSPVSSLVNQNAKQIIRRRPVNLVDVNGKLVDLGKTYYNFQVNHLLRKFLF